ncbi:MAG: sigma-70 family RNA polymerase sigma factor [Planctomycetota bacterium]
MQAARPKLLRLAYRFCWNFEDAEDAVQNAMLIATDRQNQLADPAKHLTWIKSIVVRQALDGYRRRQRDLQHTANRPRLSGPPSDADLNQSELSMILRQLIPDLPQRQQIALVLHHLESMSYEQVGELMETTAATARVQARNARETLRTAIQKDYPEWTGDF